MGFEEMTGTYLDYVFAAVDDPSLRPGATIRLQIVTERLRSVAAYGAQEHKGLF